MHVLQLLFKKGLSLPNVTWDFLMTLKCLAEKKKKVIFFVWSPAHKWRLSAFLFILQTELFPLRNTASLASIIAQINVGALQILNKVIVRTVIINIIIFS